jgi:cyclohexanone monooxygenase
MGAQHQNGADRRTNSDGLDAVIVGAGFGGMYMLHRLRSMGYAARVLEAGDGVGGTWYWNRYPGARCDVESMEYSYQFSDPLQQEWKWTERYAAQPEILRYAEHVADRFDLRRDIQFETRVLSATFDEAAAQWIVKTNTGEILRPSYCIMATGCLSSTNMPQIDGLDRFEGDIFHTGQWPHEDIDFSGRRVGIIGTGSSAIQSIPIIAAEAAHLTVFQRTANYAVPARNGPLDSRMEADIKADYAAFRERAKTSRNGTKYQINDVSALAVSEAERQSKYQANWENGGLCFMTSFNDLLVKGEANDTAAEFIRARIRKTVTDPDVAEMLSPRSVVGCKRLCVDTDYYATYNRDNVSLVDISSSPVDRITPDGLVVDGEKYHFDVIVFATGFDAMTGSLNKIDITGRAGVTLHDRWAAGPRTYLGLASAGFPNLFMITGPGSPSVLTNMLPTIEQHVEWISDLIAHARTSGRHTVDATPEAEENWVSHVNEIAGATLYPTCNSWYLGVNVPGKPRVFMPYVGYSAYQQKCAEIAANGYEGFELS